MLKRNFNMHFREIVQNKSTQITTTKFTTSIYKSWLNISLGNSVMLHLKAMVVNKNFKKDSWIWLFDTILQKFKDTSFQSNVWYPIRAYRSNYVSFCRSKNYNVLANDTLANRTKRKRTETETVLEACTPSASPGNIIWVIVNRVFFINVEN